MLGLFLGKIYSIDLSRPSLLKEEYLLFADINIKLPVLLSLFLRSMFPDTSNCSFTMSELPLLIAILPSSVILILSMLSVFTIKGDSSNVPIKNLESAVKFPFKFHPGN